MAPLVKQIASDYPALSFLPGNAFSWSPQQQTVYYHNGHEHFAWSLLHELGHALRQHQSYSSDIELVLLEAEAWEEASTIASRYDIVIDADHIQDCLDTYREWLHQRSTCPTCGSSSLQSTSESYQCFNCHTEWKVSASRFCRPYRRLTPTKTLVTSPPSQPIFR
jgi:ribosomal protein S27AE